MSIKVKLDHTRLQSKIKVEQRGEHNKYVNYN